VDDVVKSLSSINIKVSIVFIIFSAISQSQDGIVMSLIF